MKERILTKKDFTDKGLKAIINRDVFEINHLCDEDIISLWSFFKFLVTKDDEKVFVTKMGSIIWKYREELSKHNVKIKTVEEMLNEHRK